MQEELLRKINRTSRNNLVPHSVINTERVLTSDLNLIGIYAIYRAKVLYKSYHYFVKLIKVHSLSTTFNTDLHYVLGSAATWRRGL